MVRDIDVRGWTSEPCCCLLDIVLGDGDVLEFLRAIMPQND
jgi:hypothetical protein